MDGDIKQESSPANLFKKRQGKRIQFPSNSLAGDPLNSQLILQSFLDYLSVNGGDGYQGISIFFIHS